MSNILTITGRELKSYFLSPMAYVIIALFAVLTGLIFVFADVISTQQAQMSSDFNWMVILALILSPALAMRLFAEENRMGTIELLMTAPVRDWEIVAGKYIAGVLAFAAMLIPTLWHVFIISRYGSPDFGPIASSYLGILLVGVASIAVGMLWSSLTSNQVIAFVAGMISLLVLWIAGLPLGTAGSGGQLGDFLRNLTLPDHYRDLFNGVIDSQHVFYFIGLAAVAVFLTVRVVESRRWR